MNSNKKWDEICRDISDSEDEDNITQIKPRSTTESCTSLPPSSIEKDNFDEVGGILDSPVFFALKAQNTILLKSRDAKILNNSLSSICIMFSELDNLQSFIFSKYTLLPILVLLREAHMDKIRISSCSRSSKAPHVIASAEIEETSVQSNDARTCSAQAAPVFSDRTVELALQAATAVLCGAGVSGAEGLDVMQAATRAIIEPSGAAHEVGTTGLAGPPLIDYEGK